MFYKCVSYYNTCFKFQQISCLLVILNKCLDLRLGYYALTSRIGISNNIILLISLVQTLTGHVSIQHKSNFTILYLGSLAFLHLQTVIQWIYTFHFT